MLAKREPNSTANPADRQIKLAALLNQAVKADGAVDLFALLNRDQPNIEILSEQFLEKVKNSRHQALWLEAITIDWQFKESVRAKMRIEIRRALKLFKYPPDKQIETVEFVLKQAEVIADELSH